MILEPKKQERKRVSKKYQRFIKRTNESLVKKKQKNRWIALSFERISKILLICKPKWEWNGYSRRYMSLMGILAFERSRSLSVYLWFRIFWKKLLFRSHIRWDRKWRINPDEVFYWRPPGHQGEARMKFKKAASVLRYVLDILADLAAIISFILSVVG